MGRTVEIIIKATDRASGAMKGISGSLGKLGKVAGGLALGAAAGVGALAGMMGALALSAVPVEQTRLVFDRLTESIGETADVMLKDMREAALGMVSDADLMSSANRLISMGLAESSEQAGKLTQMAVTLGAAMGTGPTQAMEDFALMLANQSIPRLDTFGISAGTVRTRINELMEADQDLTREQAFMNAVMEEGAISLERVGDLSGTSATQMAQFSTTIANLKDAIGLALLPVLNALMGPLADLAQIYGPRVTEWAEKFGGTLAEVLPPKIKQFGDILTNLARIVLPILSAAISWLVENWKTLATVAAVVVGALLAISSPITLIAGAIAALAVAWITNWGGIQDKVKAVWLNVLKPIFKKLVDTLNWIRQTILPLLRKAFEDVWDIISDVVRKALDFISAYVQLVMDIIRPYIEQALTNIQVIFLSVWRIIKEWTDENWSLIRATILTVMATIRGVIETVMNVISTVIRIVLGAIRGFWEVFGEAILTFTQTVWNKIKIAIEAAVRAILGIIKVWMLLVTGDWEGAWEEIKNLIPIVWEGIKTIISLALDAIKVIVVLGMAAVVAAMVLALAAMAAAVTLVWEGIKAAFNVALARLVEIVGEWMSSIWQAGHDLMTNFRDGMHYLHTFIWDEIQWFVKDLIIGNIRGFIGSIWEAGEDLMQGFLDGLKSMGQRILNWIRNLVGQIISAIRDALNIFSPSGVMKELGKQTMAGFLEGLGAMVPAVEASIVGAVRPPGLKGRRLASVGEGFTFVYAPAISLASREEALDTFEQAFRDVHSRLKDEGLL